MKRNLEILLAVLIGGITGLSVMVNSAIADVPPLMSYQGKLTDATGAPVSDGDYCMEFKIYDSATDGNVLWSETQDPVPVTNGLFSLLLGSVSPIPDTVFCQPDRWLAVNICGEPEMVPRRRITSVGYAFKADKAQTADTADYALSAPPDDDWTISGNNMYSAVPGSVGIGTDSPGTKLDVNGGAARITNQGDGAVVLDLNTERNWQFRQLGTEANTALELANIGGGNKHFVINTAGKVGIGTTDPATKLDVNGSIKFEFDYDSDWFAIGAGVDKLKTHNLGGDPGKYIVFLYGKNDDGIHQANYGTAEQATLWVGCMWYKLTSTTITVRRAANDGGVIIPDEKRWNEARVRILKNQ